VVDEKALPALLELIQAHRTEEPVAKPREKSKKRRRGGTKIPVPSPRLSKGDEAALRELRKLMKHWTLKMYYFKRAMPKTFAEKFLVLVAWHEANSEKCAAEGVPRTYMTQALFKLGEVPPSNRARDIQQAVDRGWLVIGEEVRLSLTKAGWLALKDLIEANGDGGAGKPVTV